ncbi:hypothetical protein J6590_060299 [Homalodisca vitripennis]|nr:hypothetical protein J6590_060299 [Homalodisca vitripennis]
MDRKRNVLAKLFVSCCLHNWIRDDFIARNPKGPVTHQQHELPTQNMMPLTCVGGYAKAEGFKLRSTEHAAQKAQSRS